MDISSRFVKSYNSYEWLKLFTTDLLNEMKDQVLWKEKVKLQWKMNEQLVVSDRSRGEMSMTHFHVLCYSQQSKTLVFYPLLPRSSRSIVFSDTFSNNQPTPVSLIKRKYNT